MKVVKYGAGVIAIENFLSESECADLIARSENMGYEKATIQSIDGPKLDEEIRFNDRILFDDFNLSSALYQKANEFLPKTIDGW